MSRREVATSSFSSISSGVTYALAAGNTPAQVRDNLVNRATPNKVTSPGTGSPNRLLFAG